MLLDDLLNKYLRHSEYHKKDGSLRFDKSHLTYIINYFKDRLNLNTVEELTFDHIYSFMNFSKRRENSLSTIEKRISILKRAIKYCIEYDELESSVIVKFPNIKVKQKRYETVSDKDIKKLLKYLDKLDNSFINLRNKVIIYLFLDTGIRLNEMANIFTANIHTDKRYILLEVTKSNKERVVFFSRYTARYIRKYINQIETDYFLVNQYGKQLTYSGIIKIFNKVRNETGIKYLSSHMIRHNYGTLANKLQIPILFTKNTMGHTKIEMTERYIHFDVETMLEVYNDLSPVEYYKNNSKKNIKKWSKHWGA